VRHDPATQDLVTQDLVTQDLVTQDPVTQDPVTCTQPVEQRLILDVLTLNIFVQNPGWHDHRRIPPDSSRTDGFPVITDLCEDDTGIR
jgi:hypothetical protein